MTNRQAKITVVTRFNPRQVGYLDFRYRVEALKKAGMLDVLISNIPQARMMLGVDEEEFKLIPGGIGGLWAQWAYYRKVANYCVRHNKTHILLLHSFLSPIAAMLPNCQTYLYWNEHPSHFIKERSGVWFSLIRQLKNKLLLSSFYRGAKAATLVMPIGEHHMDDLIEAGCKPEMIKMIYMGVDDAFKVRNEKKQDAPTLHLIYTGSVKKDRGRDLMLEAVSLLNDNGKVVELTIVGASEDQISTCKKMASELGITGSVNIIGRVSGDKMPAYLQKADVGLCIWADKPYWRFNPPTKLFEYLVAGLPVVANNMRTHTKYIKDKKNGLICEYDAESLARSIRKLVSERDLLLAMKSYVAENSDEYLWSNIEKQFLSALG